MQFVLKAISLLVFLISAVCTFAQKKDTLSISASNLNRKAVKYGTISYVVYSKKTKESPSEGIYLAKISIAPQNHNNKPALTITQQWDRGDTISHKAFTVLNANDFSTLVHETYWKRLGYSSRFDFEAKTVSFEGSIADSVKSKTIQDFNESFNSYNLNWHSDLIVFTLLPYKENRVFKINLYDPGFGKPSEQVYSVAGSDILKDFSGKKIPCWVLELKFTSSVGYQKFWVAKNGDGILKEEDFFNNSYRYKIKSEISENE